jgi:hypothetical protein
MIALPGVFTPKPLPEEGFISGLTLAQRIPPVWRYTTTHLRTVPGREAVRTAPGQWSIGQPNARVGGVPDPGVPNCRVASYFLIL